MLGTFIRKIKLFIYYSCRAWLPVQIMKFNRVTIEHQKFGLVPVKYMRPLLKDICYLEGEILFDENIFTCEEGSKNYFLVTYKKTTLTHLKLDYQPSWFVKKYGENANIVGYVFCDDLKVNTYISSYDTEFSPALIVLGNLHVAQLLLSGNTHLVTDDIYAQNIYGEYNHGALYCKGSMDVSNALIMMDMCCKGINVRANIIYGAGSIWEMTRVTYSSEEEFRMSLLPNTHDLKAHLKPDIECQRLWGEDYPEYVTSENIATLFNNVPLDYPGFCHDIATRFDSLFQLLTFDEPHIVIDGEGSVEYHIGHFTKEEKRWRYVGLIYYSTYRVGIEHNIDDNCYTAYLEYLDEEQETDYGFFNQELAQDTTITRSAKYAFNMAEAAFIREASIDRIILMPEMLFELVPHSGAGNVRFGMTPREVEEIWGRPLRRTESLLRMFEERNGISLVYGITGELEAITFYETMKGITFKGVHIFAEPECDAVAELKKMTMEVIEQDDDVIFPEYSLVLSGFNRGATEDRKICLMNSPLVLEANLKEHLHKTSGRGFRENAFSVTVTP